MRVVEDVLVKQRVEPSHEDFYDSISEKIFS
jgi:hypothetical protein